ncbi:MAG: glycosyltransferase family 2 protein [Gallionella sp.]|nr:glycosyltransferase family 2 protein [Gallionella sp.]
MITASLVLFQNPPELFGPAMQSFLDGVADGLLIVSDNSPTPLQHPLFAHDRVRYVHNGCNLGFGKAHNRAISLIPEGSEFHLLLNPDIRFDANVLPQLRAFMESDATIGVTMPRITYPDGALQHLCKRLPTPVDLVFRRFIPSKRIRNWINSRYELHGLTQDQPSSVPNLSGCFLLVRSRLLKELGGFDERYFMYLEDIDLVRRIGDQAKTIYFPTVSVVHEYAKGSYVNKKLLGYHISSALKYFTKWGWWFDRVRYVRNDKVAKLISSRGLNDY